MPRRDLPVLQRTAQHTGTSPMGAAHARPRDAYRDVPILQRPPWHHLIAGYFFSGGISSGAFVIGALATMFGKNKHRKLARNAIFVSFATMLPCPVLLTLDLGKPTRFYHMLRIVKPSSPMSVGSWALVLHGGFATINACHSAAQEFDTLPAAALIRQVPEGLLRLGGLPSSLVLGGYTGVLIGTTSIPLWYTSPVLGALFMASAMNTGRAAVSLVGAMIGTDSTDEKALAPMAVVFGAAEAALLGAYLSTSGSAAAPLLRGREGMGLAGSATLTIGALVLDAVSAAGAPPNRSRTALTAVATLAGGALLRWAVIFAGSGSAMDREGTLTAMSGSGHRTRWWTRSTKPQ